MSLYFSNCPCCVTFLLKYFKWGELGTTRRYVHFVYNPFTNVRRQDNRTGRRVHPFFPEGRPVLNDAEQCLRSTVPVRPTTDADGANCQPSTKLQLHSRKLRRFDFLHKEHQWSWWSIPIQPPHLVGRCTPFCPRWLTTTRNNIMMFDDAGHKLYHKYEVCIVPSSVSDDEYRIKSVQRHCPCSWLDSQEYHHTIYLHRPSSSN